MNLIMLGLFSLNIQGVEGSIIQMISHGVVSSALFLCVGIVYDRHHTRILKYFGGLANTMPFLSFFSYSLFLRMLHYPEHVILSGKFYYLQGFSKTTFLLLFLQL